MIDTSTSLAVLRLLYRLEAPDRSTAQSRPAVDSAIWRAACESSAAPCAFSARCSTKPFGVPSGANEEGDLVRVPLVEVPHMPVVGRCEAIGDERGECRLTAAF